MRAEHVADSTRGPALPYPAGMRTSTILIPLLMILANDIRCKDDEPAGGEFGEPCGGDIATPCADGLACKTGYCEEECVNNSDCQAIEGYRHQCEAGGVCRIYCDDETLSCPDTLATPLQCSMIWCESAS